MRAIILAIAVYGGMMIAVSAEAPALNVTTRHPRTVASGPLFAPLDANESLVTSRGDRVGSGEEFHRSASVTPEEVNKPLPR